MTNVDKLQANNALRELHQKNDRRSVLFVSHYDDERALFEMVCEENFPDFSFEADVSVNNAIQKLRGNLGERIALVISDMGIHYSRKELGKRGEHLVEEMRERGLNTVPVVLSSADNRYAPDSPSGDRKVLEDLMKTEGIEYLHKPFGVEELRRTVCKAIQEIRKRVEGSQKFQ
ncbi:hypothetical protein GF366_03935 [Candidatus Peregrinibacteria bacterium]|nr:hypothetical protein [Candidatus Peregrinibacteria bacterium]